MKKSVYENHFKFGVIENCACLSLDRISFAIKGL